MVGQTKVCAPFFGADFKCIDLQLLQQGAKKQVIRMHEERKETKNMLDLHIHWFTMPVFVIFASVSGFRSVDLW